MIVDNNRNAYTFHRMVPFLMTLSDPLLDFKVTILFDVKYLENDTTWSYTLLV